MKLSIYIFSLLLILTAYSCKSTNNEDGVCSPEKDEMELLRQEWHILSCGLYQNSKGDIGFATRPDLVFVPTAYLKGENKICPNMFLTTFGYADTTQLKNVIDTTTFESVDGWFFKDKNHIYSYYAMSDGGYFNIFATDTITFKLLGNYVEYQSKIYHNRFGLIDADVESFRVSPEISHIAKDKYGYFSFNERITEAELANELNEESFEIAKAL